MEVITISRDGKVYLVNEAAQKVQEMPAPETINYLALSDEIIAKYKIQEPGPATASQHAAHLPQPHPPGTRSVRPCHRPHIIMIPDEHQRGAIRARKRQKRHDRHQNITSGVCRAYINGTIDVSTATEYEKDYYNGCLPDDGGPLLCAVGY